MNFRPAMGLFKESFRQLKIVGILGCVIYALIGIMVPIGANISVRSVTNNYSVSATQAVYVFDEKYMMIVSAAIAVIIVPIMMLVAFNFLNKRNSCDFYHAIPVKRLPAFVGIIMAVVLWTIIMIFVETFTISIMCGSLPRVRVESRSLMITAVKTFALAFFFIGVLSAGISLSGTLFSNIVVSGVIMLAPRFMIIAVIDIIGSVAECYPVSDIMSKFLDSGNVLTQIMRKMTGNGTDIGNFSAVIPTVIEGMVYFILGAFVYVHRKSETAQKPSLTYGVQSVLRMVSAYLCSLVGVGFLMSYFTNYGSMAHLFYAAVMFVVAVLVYIMYELLTSHKWSMVGRSLKQLPILVILIAVTFAAMKIVVYGINSYRIVPERTQYIEIEDVASYQLDNYDIDWDKLDRKIYDADCISAIADEYNDDTEDYYDMSTRCVVTVYQDGHRYKRNVNIKPKTLSKVAYCITKRNDSLSGNYLKKYTNNSYVDMEFISLDNSQVHAIYDCIKEEIEQNNNLLDVIMTDYSSTIGTLYIGYVYQPDILSQEYQQQRLPISYKTPKTLELLVNYAKSTVSYEEFLDIVHDKRFESATMSVGALPADKAFISQYWFDYVSHNTDLYYNLLQIIGKYGKKGCVTDDNAVIIGACAYYNSTNSDEKYATLYGIYSLSDEGMELFMKACEEINKSNTYVD